MFAALASWAVDPWPAETNTAAIKLTTIDPGLNTVNWSGAFWNPEKRMLWLACNSGYFWALVEDGAGSFRVATNAAGTPAKWTPGGDLESICQADLNEEAVYALDEDGWIRKFNVSQYGIVQQIRSWDIRPHCPETSGGLGPEGIAFVPNEWLRRERFSGSNGVPVVATNGLEGLMLIGHQDGGYVHAFDLDPSSTNYTYLGRLKTGRSETAGLEFDRSAGLLYIWHNTGPNYLEVVELGSYAESGERRLRQVKEYYGPRAGNLEGFAMTPATDTNRWCFITDDDNWNGEAVVWYTQFQPSADADGDSLRDGWELWHFGSITQTTGAVDFDGDGMDNAAEFIAGTEPTNAASILRLHTGGDGQNLVLSWASASNRAYDIRHSETLWSSVTQMLQSGIAATPPMNVATVAIPDTITCRYYRVSVRSPP